MASEWEYDCPVCRTRLHTSAGLPFVVRCPDCKSLLRIQAERVVVLERRVAQPPPGVRPAVGAIGGALLGVAVAGPIGALFGFLLGGFLGAAVEAEEQATVK